jgi:hypothetical protein
VFLVFCSMVQPTSPILIFDLGFSSLLANRLSRLNPSSLSTFVPTHYASSSFLPFILPSRLLY